MIKKLAIAAAFMASTMIAVPTAQAGSRGACMSKYMDDLIECGGTLSCEMWADITYYQCIQALNAELEPDV
nr:hypothetical protein [uncultured Brevundimonas sp.]